MVLGIATILSTVKAVAIKSLVWLTMSKDGCQWLTLIISTDG